MKSLNEIFYRKKKRCEFEIRVRKENTSTFEEHMRLSRTVFEFKRTEGGEDVFQVETGIEETDEEVIERATKEHEENLNEVRRFFKEKVYVCYPDERRTALLSVLSSINDDFSTAYDRFKRGETI